MELIAEIKSEELERTSELAQIVYKKIRNLDFPDISNYSEDIEGILAFEEDLLEGGFSKFVVAVYQPSQLN